MNSGSPTIFNFPFGIDDFQPDLINDITVVNADHVLDLRCSVLEVEKLLIGPTAPGFTYTGTTFIDGYDPIKQALEVLDGVLATVSSELGLIVTDGYLARIDSIEDQLEAHRSSSGPVDAEGYGVHNVDGYVVGTDNIQDLTNKTYDSGPSRIGAKFIARASSPADTRQIEVYDSFGTLNFWVDNQGNGFFAGDAYVSGDRVVQGMDEVKNSLTVDGSTILGNDASLDTTTINGDTSLDGDLSITGNLSNSGPTFTSGDGTGTATLNFDQLNIAGDAYYTGSLSVTNNTTFGNVGGTSSHLLRGDLQQLFGNFYTTGQFRALGTDFRVETAGTYIDSPLLIVSSSTSLFGATSLFDDGSISSDGYQYFFGYGPTKATNTFVVNAVTQIEDLTVVEDLTVENGTLTAPETITDVLTTEGPTSFIDGTEGTDGYVWTSIDTNGRGAWLPPLKTSFSSVVTDGYLFENEDGSSGVLPAPGFFDAENQDEVFLDATSGSFTVNLPSGPSLGDRVRLIDYDGTLSLTTKVFVVPDIELIMGATSLELDSPDTAIEVIFNGDSWRIF